ncbi:polyamine-transporting ATPase 13A3-like [Styela clava]
MTTYYLFLNTPRFVYENIFDILYEHFLTLKVEPMENYPNSDQYIAGSLVDTSLCKCTGGFPQKSVPEDKNSFCFIGRDDEPEYKCYPYKLSKFRYFLMVLVDICTAGFMWLMFYWRPDWKLKFTHYPSTFEKIDSVYLEILDGTKRVFVSAVKTDDVSVKKCAAYLFRGNQAEISRNQTCEGYQNSYVNERETSDDSCGGIEQTKVKYFYHHLMRYMWEDSVQTFIKIEGFDGNVTVGYVHESAENALSKEEQSECSKLHGENTIHVEVPAYLKLLISEVLNPFYVFQMFACIFWMVDEYVAYATAIIVISFISAIISLITVRRERQALHDMVELQNMAKVTVVRDIRAKEITDGPSSSNGSSVAKEYVTEEIWIKDLVPGDIITIPPSGLQLSFDAALIAGTCIVNESMLTGESIPVTKTPLGSSESELNNVFNVESQKSHVLFSGTEVIQTRYYQDEVVRAVVVRTGYGTAKGKLVHSILFPKPVNLKLLRDAYRFVGIMCGIAIIGFAYSTYTQIQHGESVRDILFKSIDIITITVPPALPLAMTIGIIYAQSRLKKVHINTISPQRINICGQVDVVAFDKTGTLTEEGLDLTDIVPVYSDKFASPTKPENIISMDKKSELIRCMTTCHSLTIINNELSGDPLDIQMFEATGWKLVEPKVEDETKYDQLQTTYVRPPRDVNDISSSIELVENSITSFSSQSEFEMGIIRQFPFLSSLQRVSVIAKPLHSGPKDMMVYVKGAPETIAKLCLSLPPDFASVLKIYTQQGHRVIAMASKSINLSWVKAQKIERNVIEKDLNFLGYLIFQNKLKPCSTAVIRDLDNAMIRTVMVTGDNLETALCVAKDCNILKSNLPILVPKFSMDSINPILTWFYIDDFGNKNNSLERRKSPLSSSEESNDTNHIINMGDSISANMCQIAVSGFDFSLIRNYFPEFIPALAVQGAIFARMSPQQKTELMEDLESVDYHSLMCGDGANDCGALKRAHVGLSLSEYEASVAAPFTARSETGIEAVPTLIREGRAALVTSFGMFKFMALYSMIQFTTVLLLYTNNSNLSDYQFLYIDLIIIDVVAITMSRNHAYKILHWKKPPTSLVCAEMLVSLFLQIFLQFGLQLLPYILVQDQCWFRTPTYLNHTEYVKYENASIHQEISTTTAPNIACPAPHLVLPEDNYQRTFETTCLFYVSSFMYLTASVAFSRGRPFRTAIYKNRWFLISLLVLSACTLFFMFAEIPEMDAFLDLWHIPELDFLFIICGIIAGHFIIALFIELFFIENPTLWNNIKLKCSCFEKASKKKYKNLESILNGKITQNIDDVESKFSIPSVLVGQPIYAKAKINYYDSCDGPYKTQL